MIPVPPVGYGGIERIVDALASGCRARGHQVGLVARRGSQCPVDRLFAWPSEDISGRLAALRNAWWILAAARRFRADVIHSYARLAYLVPGLLLQRGLTKIMSYQRDPTPSAVRWASRLGGRDLSFTGCSEYISGRGRRSGGVWHAIPNFVDTTRYDFVSKVAANAPLLFLSRLESTKGPELAIQIARAAGRRLRVAGNAPTHGSERAYFQSRVAPHLGREGIEWIGEVDDRQKNELLGSSAALLVPIQWDEPFGIVFVEALATGTPVITVGRGALPEIIRPGVTGFFVDGTDSGVRAIERLTELDRAACRRDAETRFSLSTCAEQYLQLYRQRCAESRK